VHDMNWRRFSSRLTDEVSVVLMRSPLLRVVFFDRWFRLVLLMLVLGAISLALYFPRIWRTTPRAVAPEVKVSALDLTQAWSLKRSARAAAGKREFDLANRCWQSALANNPADREAIIGFLGNYLLMNQPDTRTRNLAIGQSLWLRHLGETNRAALELTFKVYGTIGEDGLLIAMAERETKLLEEIPELEAQYLKALFRSGNIEQFHQHRRRARGRLEENLILYELARKAGWSEGIDAIQSRHELEMRAAANGAGSEVIDLQLLVCAQLNDIQGYERFLHKLDSLNQAGLRHITRYWRLLRRCGRIEEARAAARFRSLAPNSASEFVDLARIYAELQLQEEGSQALKNAFPGFTHSKDAWVSYAGTLHDCKDWIELRGLARRMRQDPKVADLKGYSYFLEGCVEVAEGRTKSARGLFAEAAEIGMNSGRVALIAANELLKFGLPDLAISMLTGHEAEMASIYEYWDALFLSALLIRDQEVLLKSATKCRDLRPDTIEAKTRYAGALLVNRAEPLEAIATTLTLLAETPDSPGAILNHAHALLQNRRFDEARGLVDSLQHTSFTPEQERAYNLAVLEIHFRNTDPSKALAVAQRIDPEGLFPSQRRRFEQIRQELVPSASSPRSQKEIANQGVH
jgi:hypothetical protein